MRAIPQDADLATFKKLLDEAQKNLLKLTWREEFSAEITDNQPITAPAQPLSHRQLSALPPVETAAPAQTTGSTIRISQKQDQPLHQLATDVKTDYEIRVLQFARAAIFTLDYQTPELDSQEKNSTARKIFETARAALGELDYITRVDPTILRQEKKFDPAARASYMNNMRKSCEKAFSMLAAQLDSNYRKGEKQLKMAEQILTWHDGRMTQVNTSFFQEGDTTYEIKREETPILGLTDAQQEEYRKILGEPKPTWFKEIEKKHPILAKYLKKQVQGSRWGILGHSLPAILRSVPGLANFTRTQTTITNLTTQKSTTGFMYRSATPPPIDVKNKSERVRLTQLNIEQYIKIRLAADDLPKKNGKHVIAINSLLNEIFGEALLRHKDNNTRMIAEIKKALAHIKKDPDYSHLEFMFTTTPINNGRNLWITLNSHRESDDDQYITYCEEKIKDTTLAPGESALLLAAQTALKQLRDRVDYFGDLNLIRSALYEIIIPGALSGCKSAKDREAYKQDYATALRVYYLAHGKFPNFKLPKYRKAKLIAKMFGYASTITAVMAGLMLLATLFAAPLSAFIIIPVALPQLAILGAMAGGLGLTLLTSLFQFTFKLPDYTQRSNFMKMLRHVRLSGFGAFSSSANAPGVYGQKDEDISPSDLTNPRQGQKPYRGKPHKGMFVANQALFSLTASLIGVAAYLLLHFIHTATIGAALTGFAAPALVSITVVALGYLVANFCTDWLNYYRNPIDKKEANHIKAFKLAHGDEIKLAKGNKMKGKDPKIKQTNRASTKPGLAHITSSSQSTEPGTSTRPVPVILQRHSAVKGDHEDHPPTDNPSQGPNH